MKIKTKATIFEVTLLMILLVGVLCGGCVNVYMKQGGGVYRNYYYRSGFTRDTSLNYCGRRPHHYHNHHRSRRCK